MSRARTLAAGLCSALLLACERTELPTAVPEAALPAGALPTISAVGAPRIVFATNRDGGIGNFEIYIMDADGQNAQRLTTNDAADRDPALSPDGSRIAFTSSRGGALDPGNLDIWVMNVDGTSLARLTSDAASDVRPAWSPDGTRIAFTSARDGENEIFVMDADGQNAVQLTNNTSFDASPAWSADGSKIAFACVPEGSDLEICIMNADGTGQASLTNNGFVENDPSWSPDGRIAFTSDRNGLNASVFVMNADGSNVQQLTPSSAGPDDQPAWSPDGTRIAFVRANDIWVIAADGSDSVNVTNDGSQTIVNQNPDWGTPDPSTADLAIQGSAATGAAKTLVYTITVGNLGPDGASDVLLSSVLPAGARLVAATTTQGSCSSLKAGSSTTVECALGPIASDGNVTAQITVKVNSPKARPSVSATVSSATSDPDPTNNSATIAAP